MLRSSPRKVVTGDGQHDQRVLVGGPGQRGFQGVGDVEPVRRGGRPGAVTG